MKLAALTVAAALFAAPFSLAASPQQLAMPVGSTTTVTMPAPISRVTVEAPGLVEVKKRGRELILVGRETGRTQLVVHTLDGELRFSVYVAKDKYALPY
jgi:Flp pilus assembly secretin CpaC